MEPMVLRLIHKIWWKSRRIQTAFPDANKGRSGNGGERGGYSKPVTGVLLCLDVTGRVYEISLV